MDNKLAVIGSELPVLHSFPARDWGPRLAYTILPIPHKGTAEWGYAWVPMCGPLVGGILAAGLQYWITY